MMPVIRQFLALQELDLKRRGLAEQLAVFPGRRQELARPAEGLRAALARVKELIQKQEKRYREIERDLDALEEKKKKQAAVVYQVKTQQELNAANHELDHLDRQYAELEEEGVALLDDLAQLKAAVARNERELQAGQAELAAQSAKLDEAEASLTAEAAALDAARAGLTDELKPELLQLYEQLAAKRGGIAVAAVEINRGVCGACEMQQRPQILENVYAETQLVRCEGCARILYLEGVPESAPAAEENSPGPDR